MRLHSQCQFPPTPSPEGSRPFLIGSIRQYISFCYCLFIQGWPRRLRCTATDHVNSRLSLPFPVLILGYGDVFMNPSGSKFNNNSGGFSPSAPRLGKSMGNPEIFHVARASAHVLEARPDRLKKPRTCATPSTQPGTRIL